MWRGEERYLLNRLNPIPTFCSPSLYNKMSHFRHLLYIKRCNFLLVNKDLLSQIISSIWIKLRITVIFQITGFIELFVFYYAFTESVVSPFPLYCCFKFMNLFQTYQHGLAIEIAYFRYVVFYWILYVPVKVIGV